MAAISADWDKFISICRREGVPDGSLRWYIVRIERYLKSYPDRPVESHTAADVQRYLERAGIDAGTPSWQFRQLVHAMQLFWCYVVGAAWAESFDWSYWLASGQELESDHPTIARHNSAVAADALNPGKNLAQQNPMDVERALIARIRLKNYSIRTEQAYVHWLRAYMRFHHDRDVHALDARAVASYLNHLALERDVSRSTQGQALSALVFLYAHVLQRPLGHLAELVAAKKPRRLPTVLTRTEVRTLLAEVTQQPLR